MPRIVVRLEQDLLDVLDRLDSSKAAMIADEPW